MKHIFILTVTWLLLFQNQIYAQQSNLPASLIRSVQNGDSEGLSVYFSENIELVLPGKAGIYSKNQAELILKEVFNAIEPNGFKVIHEGTRENSSFTIGQLNGKNEHFRVYFLTKKNAGKIVIHQLRIEAQND